MGIPQFETVKKFIFPPFLFITNDIIVSRDHHLLSPKYKGRGPKIAFWNPNLIAFNLCQPKGNHHKGDLFL